MEKLAICTLNHKGGVGKSTAALIMAQTAAMMKLHVLCIDLDEQKNLTDAMSLVSKQFSSLVTVKDHLDKNDAELDFDLFVIDCPPKLDKATASAIAFADIVLVPVKGDLFSVTNLPVVWDFAIQNGKHLAQIALIKNSFINAKAVRNVDEILYNRKYHIAGRWPRNEHIPNNILEGRPWWMGMDERQKAPFVEFYHKVLMAWQRLLAGDFETTWKN